MLEATHSNQTPSLVGDEDGGDNFHCCVAQNHKQW